MNTIADAPSSSAARRPLSLTLDRWSTPAEPGPQGDVADAVLGSWTARELPPGLDVVTSYASSRGDVVLTTQQWNDPAAQEEWHRRSGRAADPAPDEHLDTRHFFHRRGFLHQHAAPSCTVLVTFDFDSVGRTLRWTDLLAEAIAGDEQAPPGCIARHLFLGWDLRSVLSLSLWVHEDDHRRSIEEPATGPAWRRIEGFPGLTHGPGARCRTHGTVENRGAPYRGIVPGGRGAST